jgi:hypothetical protein
MTQSLSEANIDRLERLVRLRDSGALTEQEFEDQKGQILRSLTPDEQTEAAPSEPQARDSAHSRRQAMWWIGGIAVASAILMVLWSYRPGATAPPATSNQSANSAANGAGTSPRGMQNQVSPAAAITTASQQRNAPAVFPPEFRGLWGTSPDSCAGRDDYGPMEVSRRGFTFYEAYGTLARPPRQISPGVIEVQYLPDEEEPNPPRERWTLHADGSLTRIDTRFRRCPPGTRRPT